MNIRKLVTGKDAIPIDEANLDKEWLVIAEQIYDAMEKQTDAEEKHLRMEDRLSRLKVTTYAKVSQNPDDYDLTKTTEAALKAAVEIDTKVVELSEKLITAKIKLEHAKNDVKGLTEKRRALEHLVTLFGLSYTGVPKDKTGSAPKMKKALDYERRHKWNH